MDRRMRLVMLACAMGVHMRERKKSGVERVGGNGAVPTEPRRIAKLGHLKDTIERGGEEKKPYEGMERPELAKRLAGKKVLFVSLGSVDVLTSYAKHLRGTRISVEIGAIHANQGQEGVLAKIREGWDVVIFNFERSLEDDARRVAGYAYETGAKLVIATTAHTGKAKTAFGRRIRVSGAYEIGSARHDFADFERVLLDAVIEKESGTG